MNYIVLDLEWNYPYGLKKMVTKPIRLEGEIVQIGAVKLDEKFQVVDSFKIWVTPKYYKKMHKKVTGLTKITDEDLQYGFPFPVSIKHFKKWCGDSFVFLTWGGCDVEMLRANLIVHKLDTEWLTDTYNIQLIFDAQITKEKRHVSLLYAMEAVGEQPRDAHDALNDAQNTVRVCTYLDMERGLAEYQELLPLQCGGLESLESSQPLVTYDTREQGLIDQALVNFICPYCGANCVCTEMVQQNSAKYISIAQCNNGDEIFVRFKFKRLPDGKYSVFRNLYEIDENNRSYYHSKKERNEERKKSYIESIPAQHPEELVVSS